MMAERNRLRDFLLNLECLCAAGQHDAFVHECETQFGGFLPPDGRRSHLWTIDLHNIEATGETAEAACASWKRLAHAQEALDDSVSAQ